MEIKTTPLEIISWHHYNPKGKLVADIKEQTIISSFELNSEGKDILFTITMRYYLEDENDMRPLEAWAKKVFKILSPPDKTLDIDFLYELTDTAISSFADTLHQKVYQTNLEAHHSVPYQTLDMVREKIQNALDNFGK